MSPTSPRVSGLGTALTMTIALGLSGGCTKGGTKESLHLGPALSYGFFLEKAPTFRSTRGTTHFLKVVSEPRPDYRRVELTDGSTTTIQASLRSTPATRTVTVTCPGPLRSAELHWWVLRRETGPTQHIELRLGNDTVEADTPKIVGRAELHWRELDESFCQDKTSENIAFVSGASSSEILLGPVRVVAVAEQASKVPPIILISVDTLRADYWDHEREREDVLATSCTALFGCRARSLALPPPPPPTP